MKFRHQSDDHQSRVSIEGSLDSTDCDCLSRFWDHYLSGRLDSLIIDMSAVDEIDSASVCVMVDLVRRSIADGCVTLVSPPQTLAHTLYKAGMLASAGRLEIKNPRDEEPLAG